MHGTVNTYNVAMHMPKGDKPDIIHIKFTPKSYCWRGMCNGILLGPYLFEENVNGARNVK